jgi:hypothetical protein
MEDKKDKLFAMLEKVGVLSKLKADDKELVGKPLMKRVMQVRLTFCYTMGVQERQDNGSEQRTGCLHTWGYTLSESQPESKSYQ